MDRGISFPLVRGDTGFFQSESGTELIRGDILQILGTIPGERVMLPEFGSRVRELVFEHLDPGTLVLAKAYTIDAIKRWEKRVDLLQAKVEAGADESTLIIQLEYRYRETGENTEMTILIEKGGAKLWAAV